MLKKHIGGKIVNCIGINSGVTVGQIFMINGIPINVRIKHNANANAIEVTVRDSNLCTPSPPFDD